MAQQLEYSEIDLLIKNQINLPSPPALISKMLRIVNGNTNLAPIEQGLFRYDHQQVGGLLLNSWGIPESICRFPRSGSFLPCIRLKYCPVLPKNCCRADPLKWPPL